MPLVYQQNINAFTKIGVWHITETEFFFTQKVALQKNIAHAHKRLQHLAGRYLLQELYPDFPVALIKIAHNQKPFLKDETYHFSISHCKNYAAVLISKTQRTGVDIELLTEKIKNIIPKFLSEDERALLNPKEIEKTATLFWCAKESIYKWQNFGDINFKKDIIIKNWVGHADKGIVNCLFKDNMGLQVHYLLFKNNYLTWVLS